MSIKTAITPEVPEITKRGWDKATGRVIPSAGMWGLQWPDGMFVGVWRRSSEWSPIPLRPKWTEYGRLGTQRTHESELELPLVRTRTRRELVQILTEWRRRELAIRAAKPQSLRERLLFGQRRAP